MEPNQKNPKNLPKPSSFPSAPVGRANSPVVPVGQLRTPPPQVLGTTAQLEPPGHGQGCKSARRCPQSTAIVAIAALHSAARRKVLQLQTPIWRAGVRRQASVQANKTVGISLTRLCCREFSSSSPQRSSSHLSPVAGLVPIAGTEHTGTVGAKAWGFQPERHSSQNCPPYPTGHVQDSTQVAGTPGPGRASG